MIFELQWKLAFKSLSGRHDATIGPFLQHTAIPVVGAHHSKEDAILKSREDHRWTHTNITHALHTKMSCEQLTGLTSSVCVEKPI